MPGPSIRASFFHSNLKALAALGPEAARRVLARMPPEVLQEVEGAARIAWVPLEHDLAITDAIEAELGRDALRRWARDGVLRAGDTPLLSPLIRSARAIFGMTPHAFLRRAPLAWTLLFRECGRLEYGARGERSARIELYDAPAVLLASQAYLEGMSAGLEAAIDLAREAGRVRVEQNERETAFSADW